MSRLSIRPRPLDIHKKLPIVKSFKDFEDDNNDTNPPTSSIAANTTPSATTTRNSHLLRLNSSSFDHDSQEVHQVPSKKSASEIPTPQFVVVDTYERDYSQTFDQPTSYLRARGARAELGDFVEYDLDNEDEDWLDEFNRDQKLLPPEKFETLMFKLEVLDHKARERAGLITPTLGSPIPILLQLGVAIEALKDQTTVGYAVFQSVYHYWKEKRERWPNLYCGVLQVSVIQLVMYGAPPPVNDTQPIYVFSAREKLTSSTHEGHSSKLLKLANMLTPGQSFDQMQRRENNVAILKASQAKHYILYFNVKSSILAMRLCVSLAEIYFAYFLVRRNLDQAKSILEALIKVRERKKERVMEGEVNLQQGSKWNSRYAMDVYIASSCIAVRKSDCSIAFYLKEVLGTCAITVLCYNNGWKDFNN
ncbi:hypothetical protein CUMW_175870 [Citrus unshiu]|uniref:Enhancer of polycomb-like protein n=1 Tax=Citrus unshiu TaxID=55188 RepID=A0A2H5PX97_CITUN|nr:hypothetical protein CUMW_175870 [Citrus unshiu]